MNQQSTNLGHQRRVVFGRYLKELRDQRDRTQIEVEDSLHMKHGRLSLIESGDRPVPDLLLEQLAREYGVPPEELVMKKYRKYEDSMDTALVKLKKNLRTSCISSSGASPVSCKVWRICLRRLM